MGPQSHCINGVEGHVRAVRLPDHLFELCLELRRDGEAFGKVEHALAPLEGPESFDDGPECCDRRLSAVLGQHLPVALFHPQFHLRQHPLYPVHFRQPALALGSGHPASTA